MRSMVRWTRWLSLALVELAVDEARLLVQVLGQGGAPAFHIAQESLVHAQHALGRRLEQVAVPPLAHGFRRERLPQPFPGLKVLRMRQIQDAGIFGGIALQRFDAAVVDGELGEIGQDADGGIARPAVGAAAVRLPRPSHRC